MISEGLNMFSNQFTVLANLGGIPSGVVPAGDIGGIPTGLQVMGNAFEDQRVLDVMYGFEGYR
jgi:aspartyl-tRNA(Asn)/glutamyl-tRNA(Gln) amidotransferase subunit A